MATYIGSSNRWTTSTPSVAWPDLVVLRLAESIVLFHSGSWESEVLLAEVDGELRVALSLADGSQIADPFFPSLHLVELLRTHASTHTDARSYAGTLRLARCWPTLRLTRWRALSTVLQSHPMRRPTSS